MNNPTCFLFSITAFQIMHFVTVALAAFVAALSLLAQPTGASPSDAG